MKKKNLLLFVFSFFLNNAIANTQLHMVLFGNTTDGSIGQSMMIDVSYYDYLYSELKMVLANEGVDVKYNRFIGNDCSPQNVNNYLDNLSCNGDIVFFIYTGHGGRSYSDTSKFPRMCLGSNYADEWIKVSRVVDIIKSKGARFQIIVADCCNSYYDRPTRQNAEGFAGKTGIISANVIKKLFNEVNGNVCITAASPGEYGWCNSRDGSFLSYYFISTLQNTNESITWQELFETISNKTFEKTDVMYRDKAISNSQRPVFDVFVSENNTNNDNLTDDNNGNDHTIVDDDNVRDNPDYNFDWDSDINDGNHNNNNDNSNVNDYDYGREKINSTAIFTSIIYIIIGYFLLSKVPNLFRNSGILSFAFKLLGVLSIIKGLLVLFP